MTAAAKPFNTKVVAQDLEAFETPRWAIEALLRVEILTPSVVDPCNGTGAIARVLSERGHRVKTFDIMDWRIHLPSEAIHFVTGTVADFFSIEEDLTGRTVFMNPPFSLACEFVDHAMRLGARKIVCFQRQAWRESIGRREWGENNRPARVWVCGARATCWRFDLLTCEHEGGVGACPSAKLKAKKKPDGAPSCQHCLGGVPTSHAFYIWEQGHAGAEMTGAIYPQENENE